ncbi:MAG TPA: hypothetical protein VF092_30585 [Longimicrobium sp.]
MIIQQMLISADSTPLLQQQAEWPAQVQAWMSVIAALIALGGFLAVWFQIKQLKEAVQAETHGRIYEHALEVQRVFLEYPEFRRFFYDRVSLDGGGIRSGSLEHARLLAFAELVADYLEHISLQCEHVPEDVQEAWKNYRDHLIANSPLLCSFLKENRRNYSREFVALCPIDAATGPR